MDNNKKYETPEAKEALIDGLSLICQRLNEFYDGKQTSIMPISKLLVTLSLPENKQYNEVKATGYHDYMAKLHAARGLIYVGDLPVSQLKFHIFLRKPIKTIDDLKNMKIHL